MKVFENQRNFDFEDVFKSHSQILLRSGKNELIDRKNNLDLIFVGVTEVKLPMFFLGIQINMEIIPDSEIRVYHVMCLKEQLEGYFIKAVSLGVYENVLDAQPPTGKPTAAPTPPDIADIPTLFQSIFLSVPRLFQS